ncbi:BglG family transcription antiterminator [Alicyclobacillus sp. ALC3]|uniref:BglG family transcription antiterminator n=1 Tax=Alicyclobacillus sp. ALC3 TaxID=2796143 RepID=UPI00237918A4|nr:BglG family transcription antiterminator [Alicyclobacillus sp. ALC3]WDL99073.1 BglG family transcription antiterminator [Alicyclobacillus sp. ALC3]
MAAKLTLRQKYILHLTLETEGGSSVDELVRRLMVSRRTIQRDLNAVGALLSAFDLALEAGAHTIRIAGKQADIERMRLAVGKLPDAVTMTQKDRELQVLMDLLMEAGPSKLEYFGRLLHVTPASLSQSLDDVSDWLEGRGLQLIRKRGYGVEVEGGEATRREALAELVYEQVPVPKLVAALREPHHDGSHEPWWNWFTRWFRPATLTRVREVLQSEFADSNPPLDAAALFGFMLHVLLTVARVDQGAHLSASADDVDDASQDVQVCRRILLRLLPEGTDYSGEAAYLAKHLRGAKVLMTEENRILPIHITAVDLAYRMVRHLEDDLGLPLVRDQDLIAGMAQHLEPAIHRLTAGLHIRNPLLPDILRHYQTLFDAIRTASDEVLAPYGLVVPDAEIGYLTMHLGASVERQRAKSKWRARIVCLNGISSAELLASRIEKELPQLQIVGLGGRDEAQAVPYDLILSTVPLAEPDVPVVTVSPFLTETERDKVLDVLRRLEQGSPAIQQSGQAVLRQPHRTPSTTRVAVELSGRAEIATVSATAIHAVIEQVADAMYTDGEADTRDALMQAMLHRERLGSIVLPGQHLSVLHARTDALHRCQIRLCRLTAPLTLKGVAGTAEQVDTVLVLLARESESLTIIQCLGRLSSALVMDRDMVDLLRQAPVGEVRERMRQAMETIEE